MNCLKRAHGARILDEVYGKCILIVASWIAGRQNGSENDATKVKYIEVNLHALNLAFHSTGFYHLSVDQNRSLSHRYK